MNHARQPAAMLVATDLFFRRSSGVRLPGQSADFERLDRTESGGALLESQLATGHACRMRFAEVVVKIGDHAVKIREAQSVGLEVWKSMYGFASPSEISRLDPPVSVLACDRRPSCCTRLFGVKAPQPGLILCLPGLLQAQTRMVPGNCSVSPKREGCSV